MKLSEIILSQTAELVIMCAGGMTVMILRDLLRLYQRKRRPAAAIEFLQDILFWILAALLASAFLYRCAFGSLSVHAMGAFAIGAALWETCFVKKISESFGKFYDIIERKSIFKRGTSGKHRDGEEKKKPRL